MQVKHLILQLDRREKKLTQTAGDSHSLCMLLRQSFDRRMMCAFYNKHFRAFRFAIGEHSIIDRNSWQ
jgi:hypothetical protein